MASVATAYRSKLSPKQYAMLTISGQGHVDVRRRRVGRDRPYGADEVTLGRRLAGAANRGRRHGVPACTDGQGADGGPTAAAGRIAGGRATVYRDDRGRGGVGQAAAAS